MDRNMSHCSGGKASMEEKRNKTLLTEPVKTRICKPFIESSSHDKS